VSLQDAGSYYCSGDNGLGHTDKEELILDVQYGPQIVVSGANDVDLGETISLTCAVSANPRPLAVRWLRRDQPDFEQQGAQLQIPRARAEHGGEYICSSYNFLHPTGRDRLRRERNATVVVNVRHQPGAASILPEEAIAVAGRSVTLVCRASPPGYPEPSYRWWREGKDSAILSVSSHYTIETVEVASAGRYYCQPHNSLGHVKPASVDLQVYLTPKLTSSPPPRLVKQARDSNLLISCSAAAKPKPNVRWFKDGVELVRGGGSRFKVSTTEQGQNVLSTLNFAGDGRDNTNKLDHKDKGHYSCQFENQVGRSEHTTLLIIEHAPIQEHRHNKVAFDAGEQGQIHCRMRAYPEPRFDWTFGDDVLQLDVVNYSSNVTQLDQDLFESVLTVTRVRETSYGEYTCRALNSMGALRTKIQLQRKGPPEAPDRVEPRAVGAHTAVIDWLPGFNGGFTDTAFVVEYGWSDGRVETGQCGVLSSCNITVLHQHTRYNLRVKAVNAAGESNWSEPITFETPVDLLNIPRPDSLVFELSTGTAHVRAPSSALTLVAELEVLDSATGGWSKYGEQRLGEGETYGRMPVTIAQAYSQLPILEEGGGVEEEVRRPSGIRARLCLEENSSACGPYLEGRTVTELVELAQPWLIALVVVVTLLGLVAVLIAIKCVCATRRKGPGKAPVRGTKMLGRHPGMEGYKSSDVFAIAGEHQHGNLPSSYDLGQQVEHGSSNSHTDSANSQVRSSLIVVFDLYPDPTSIIRDSDPDKNFRS
jgi:echinoid protein